MKIIPRTLEMKASIYFSLDPAQSHVYVALIPLSSSQAEAGRRGGTPSLAAHPADAGFSPAGFLTANRLVQYMDHMHGLSNRDPSNCEQRRAAVSC